MIAGCWVAGLLCGDELFASLWFVCIYGFGVAPVLVVAVGSAWVFLVWFRCCFGRFAWTDVALRLVYSLYGGGWLLLGVLCCDYCVWVIVALLIACVLIVLFYLFLNVVCL